ncbi:MAG: phosphotransferase [Planctomycetaceae bacterium]
MLDCDGKQREIVVKQRRCSVDRISLDARAQQTLREYNEMYAAYSKLYADSSNSFSYCVPRPLVAIPEHGLLCMELCRGRSVRSLLRRAVALPWKSEAAASILQRCGRWLRQFAPITTAQRERSRPSSETLDADGSRKAGYVYALIGAHGEDLARRLIAGAARRLDTLRFAHDLAPRVVNALRGRCRPSDFCDESICRVHGKFSVRDIFATEESISVIDFENAGFGSSYIDLAFLVYEIYMINRWNPLAGPKLAEKWRDAFLSGYGRVDHSKLNCFVAYLMINSLKPGGGIAAAIARRYASRWLRLWIRHPHADLNRYV